MDVDGVPVSLKDQFDIAGTELTQGTTSALSLSEMRLLTREASNK
jgi:Asp-tRNA(Asn)/Glu-tRNA(Gln) amidotransferase A subunit family amidase